MKICDCSCQLTTLMNQYNKILEINSGFTSSIINLNYSELEKTKLLFQAVIDMYEVLRKNAQSYNNSDNNAALMYNCFIGVDFIALEELGQKYIDALDFIDMNLGISAEYYMQTCREEINGILSNMNCLNKINDSLSFIAGYIEDKTYNKDKIDDFIKDIFDRSNKARSIAINYINSLELPTQSDWEVE